MACPDHAQVTMFVRGDLPAEQVSRFEAHLDECEHCLLKIAEAADASAAQWAHEESHTASDDSVFIHLLAAIARRSEVEPKVDSPPARARFGRYRVVGPLGRGAMGIVYRAVDDATSTNVAVKTVACDSPKVLAAMRQEIAFLERSRHPGIVSIFESGTTEGAPWYAMELLEGTTLDAYHRELWGGWAREFRPQWSPAGDAAREPPPAAGGRLEEVLEIFAALCGPIGYVHREGIVHCDLKPANIFLRNGGQPVLMDFGLLSRARGMIGRESLEVGGQVRGTLPYLAPELIRGQIPDARADLYAFGCILYESMTGRTPFVAATVNGYLEAHLRTEPDRASRWVAGMPPLLDEVLLSLLAKHPAQRFGSAEVLAERLTRVIRPAASKLSSSRPSTPYLFRPRMIGRDAVVERILGLRPESERGRGQMVLVAGESGIGKTFLASEIALRMTRAGFDVVIGECAAIPSADDGAGQVAGAALQPFRALLQHAADHCRRGSANPATRLFGSDQTIAILSRYEPALRHLLASDAAEDVAALPMTAERERLLYALSDLLERLTADRPLLLVLDDVQWADDLSLAVLDFLADGHLSGKRLLVMALYRSEELPAAVSDLEKKCPERIRLDRLDAHAVKVLVGDLLSANPEDGFIRVLADHSEGNPFFVAEYLRAGAMDGLLRRTAEGWELAPSEGYRQLGLPPTLHALLERRLGGLTALAQRVTEAAAVLGRESSLQMLGPVAGASDEDLRRAVDEMVKGQIVQRMKEGNVRFLHDKTREAAYTRSEATRREAMHRAAADAVERVYAQGPEMPAHYAELGYHLRRGGESGRAVDYFERAAEHALRASAHRDALRFFREASEASAAARMEVSPGRRASWARRSGDALQGVGDLSGSKAELVKALTLMGHPQPEGGAALGLGIARKLGKQFARRVLPARRREVDPTQNAMLLEAAGAYDRLMQIHYYRGEYGPLFFANLATLELAEKASPSPTLVVAYTNAGAAAGVVPMRSVADLYFRLAESTLAKAYDREVESYFRLLFAHYRSGLGEWAEATRAARRGMALAEDLGFSRRWEDGAAVFCNLTWGRDFEDCLKWCDRLHESASRRGDSQMTSWGLLRRAEVHTARGDREQAERNLVEAERIVPELGLPEQIRAIALRAHQMAVHDLDGAIAAADRAAALIRATKAIHAYCIEPFARLAELRLRVWRERGARRSGKESADAGAACRTLRSAAKIFPIAVPRYCLNDGRRRWLSGDRSLAIKIWRRGLAAARSLDVPYDEALLLLELATHPLAFTARDADLRREGERVLSRLGVLGTQQSAGA